LENIKCSHYFKNAKRLPAKHEANTTKTFEDCFTQLDRKFSARNCRILLFTDQCASYLKNTTFFRNIKIAFLPANCISQLYPLDFGIILAFRYHYRKQLIWKAVFMVSGRLLQGTIKMKLDMSVPSSFLLVQME
jgi:hypothetical protein